MFCIFPIHFLFFGFLLFFRYIKGEKKLGNTSSNQVPPTKFAILKFTLTVTNNGREKIAVTCSNRSTKLATRTVTRKVIEKVAVKVTMEVTTKKLKKR